MRHIIIMIVITFITCLKKKEKKSDVIALAWFTKFSIVETEECWEFCILYILHILLECVYQLFCEIIELTIKHISLGLEK